MGMRHGPFIEIIAELAAITAILAIIYSGAGRSLADWPEACA
jgi:hypothetical protein